LCTRAAETLQFIKCVIDFIWRIEMGFDNIPELLAEILQEQRNTTNALLALGEALVGIKSKVDTPAVQATATAEAAIKKAATPKAKVAPVEATEPAPAPVATPAPAPKEEPKGALTYTVDVAPTMGKLLTEKGPTIVRDLLSKYGAKRGSEIPAEKLAEALGKAKELLNG
jgi:hypothetical protein